jgi:hypothetical protein
VRPVEARPDRTERTESSTEFSQHFRENHNSVFTSWHFHRNKFLVFLAFPIQFPAYEAKRHAVALFIQISYYNIAFSTHNKHPLSTTQKIAAQLIVRTQGIAMLWHLELDICICLSVLLASAVSLGMPFVHRAAANLFPESSAVRGSSSSSL